MPITASINVTPDGFCNHDDVVADEEFMNGEAALIERADYVVIGRKTYDLFVPYWPQAARDEKLDDAERRLAKAIDETPRLLVSRSIRKSDWAGTKILADFNRVVAAEWSKKADLVVLGSPSIFTQLSQWDLIDSYHFVIEPFVAREGVRLFSSKIQVERSQLVLKECRAYAGGAVSLTYAKTNADDS